MSNIKAFLDMLAWSEGTTRVKGSDNGYNVIVGGSLFHDYSDHPRKMIKVNNHLFSTAAGRYQLLARYYTAYKRQLKLTDFSPTSQDAIAIQQIKECKAFADIENGKITKAIGKCSNIWASLPGSPYGQRVNKMEDLLVEYAKAGGKVEWV